MAKTKSDSIIRAGDRVRIITPVLIDRVGYEHTAEIETDRISSDPALQAKINALIEEASGKSGNGLLGSATDFEIYKVASALGYVSLKRNMKMGAKRQIFRRDEQPDLKDQVLVVHRVKMVRTGSYYPASGGRSTYWGYEDYDPPGLDNPQSHKTLILQDPAWLWSEEADGGYWIEACNVEKLLE